MPDRYDDRDGRNPYSSGRGFAREHRNVLERAGDEVRSWFRGDDRYDRGREEADSAGRGPSRGYGRDDRGAERARDGYGRESWQDEYEPGYYQSGRGFSRESERSPRRDWAIPHPHPDRPEAWAPDRAFSPSGPREEWPARDAVEDTIPREGWSAPRSTWERPGGSRGFYEMNRGDVYQFDHRTETFAGRGPKGYRRSDDRIREDVCDRLTDDPRIDATEVEVAVANGEVTLSGLVLSRAQKHHAEDLVERITGVREVHNNLRVGRPMEG